MSENNMERLNEILERLRQRHNNGEELTPQEFQRRQCNIFNNRIGTLNEIDGYNCPECKNKGELYYIDAANYMWVRECKCMNVRRMLRRAKESGLGDVITDMTFDKFETTEQWQAAIKAKAQAFCNDDNSQWFYIGGQSGCGKSHICTAIAAHYIKTGRECKYMLWRDEAVKLKALVNEHEQYQAIIGVLKNISVLYIDDFLKTQSGSEPTTADMNLAFEILNHRLLDKNKITIISSEYIIGDALAFDEATIGRIYQQAGDYKIGIAKDMSKNYRLK